MKGQNTKTRPISRRALLLAVPGAFAAGGAIWWAARRYTPQHDNPRLTVTEAHAAAKAGRVLLVDIRTPTEWRRSGIPAGAVPLDMRRKDFTNALLELSGGDTDRPVALICAGGVRSARLSLRLANAGFTQVMDVPEGMFGSAAGPGWLRSDLPVVEWNS